jgi:hypothetical protein
VGRDGGDPLTDRAIVSCCFAPHNPEYYAKFADRLEASLGQYAPNADKTIYRKFWPPQSPSHQELTYAFKYYAVKAALDKGYRYVMWLDAGTQVIAPIDPLWQLIERCGYGLLKGADNLGKWISDEALKYFGVDREYAMKLSLAGGCFIGIDRESPLGMKFFEKWGQIVKVHALMTGANRRLHDDGHGVMRSLLVTDATDSVVSLDPRVEGHRSDEACFSIIAEQLGMEMMSYTDWQKVCKTY